MKETPNLEGEIRSYKLIDLLRNNEGQNCIAKWSRGSHSDCHRSAFRSGSRVRSWLVSVLLAPEVRTEISTLVGLNSAAVTSFLFL